MSSGLFARRPLRRMLRHWRERHRHPFNFAIHLIGIPLAVAGVVLLLTLPWDQWYWGAGAFVLGYVLQYIGHRVEGNDLGEWAGIKRLLGLRYIAIAPRWQHGQAESAPGSAPNGRFKGDDTSLGNEATNGIEFPKPR